MMWKEFEEIAGYEVSFEDYNNIIEPMYMAVNLSKKDFIATLDKKRFALPTKQELVKKMKKEANHLFDICGHYTDYESEQRLEKLGKDYARRFYGIDWSNDLESYVYTIKEYEYPALGRGCTYPKELVIGRNNHDYERITLVK